MFLILWEFLEFFDFLECPPRILRGFTWRLQRSLHCRIDGRMFLIFVKIFGISLFFRVSTRILHGFIWRLQSSLQLIIVRYDRVCTHEIELETLFETLLTVPLWIIPRITFSLLRKSFLFNKDIWAFPIKKRYLGISAKQQRIKLASQCNQLRYMCMF